MRYRSSRCENENVKWLHDRRSQLNFVASQQFKRTIIVTKISTCVNLAEEDLFDSNSFS